VFAHDVSWVSCANNVMEVGDSSSNCLPGVVTREGVMALVKLGVRDEGPVYSQFIVSKYKRRAIN